MIDGRRTYGPARQDPMDAHRDATRMRADEEARPAVTVTLKEAADAMHDEIRHVRRAGTVEFYEQKARAVFRILNPDLPLERLTPAVLQSLIAIAQQGKFSARTIQHYRRWLHRLVTWAMKPQRQWFRGENPVPLASWPEAQTVQPDVMDAETMVKWLDQLRAVPEDYDVVLFLAFTGLRRAEFARLQAIDFDLQRRLVWVRGKTKDEAVPLVADIAEAAGRLVARAEGGHVVPGTEERRRVQWIDRLFRRWAKRFDDARFHPHALRHSLATNLIRAGVPAGTVQRQLRHSSYTTTQRYVHLVAEDLHDAATHLRYVVGRGEKREHG